MQYTLPPQENPPQNVLEIHASSEAQRLSDSNASPDVRAALLNIYLDRVIKENENANVTTGILISDINTGAVIKNYNTDTEQYAASINKLPIARLLLNDIASGKLSPDTTLEWTTGDQRQGAGAFDKEGAPTSGTVDALLYDLLHASGNTAVRVLVNQGLGGVQTTNERFKSELGLGSTYLNPVPTVPNGFDLGNTTPQEALQNMTALLGHDSSYVSSLKNALATNIYQDYGVRSQLAGNDYIVLANKVGILDDPTGNNRHDVGIIYNTQTQKSYAYAFLTTATGSPESASTSQAGVSLADMGRGLLRYSGDKATSEKAFRDIRPFTESRINY